MASAEINFVTVNNGLSLCSTEYGVPQGEPIIYCHGFPASRLEAAMFAAAAIRNEVRLIAVDRPGFGRSDYQPDRRMTGWPLDILRVADSLGLERFGVLGVSGGAPYALACASQIADRLSAVGIVCGLGPMYQSWAVRAMAWNTRLPFILAARAEWLLRFVYGRVTTYLFRRYPHWVRALLTAGAPGSDTRVLERPEIGATLTASLREALRQGSKGALRDLVLYTNSWGFEIRDIGVPIDLWHGEADATVPVSHGHFYAAELPNVRERLLAAEGHFSLPILFIDEILDTLMRRSRVGF